MNSRSGSGTPSKSFEEPAVSNMSIRIAEVEDLSELVAIYNQAIEAGNATADTEAATIDSRLAWFDSHDREKHPIYVYEQVGCVVGWCSLSPYRPGRTALRFTAELSYYVSKDFRKQGIASALIRYAMNDCDRLGIKTLFGILLDTNEPSVRLLRRFGFETWGHLPGVADFDGNECGHLYLGKRICS